MPLVNDAQHDNEANRLSGSLSRTLVQYKTTSSGASNHTGSNSFLKTFSLSNVLSLGNRNSPKVLSEKASTDVESKSTSGIETMTITNMEEKDLSPNTTVPSGTEIKEKNENENAEYSESSYNDSENYDDSASESYNESASESYNNSDSESYEEDEESSSEELESSDESNESSNGSSEQQSTRKEPIVSEGSSEQSEQKREESTQQKSFQKRNEKVQSSQRKQSDARASKSDSKGTQTEPARKRSTAEHPVQRKTKESGSSHLEVPTQNKSEGRSNSLQVSKKSPLQPSNARNTEKHVEWMQSVDPPKSRSAIHLRKKHPHRHHHRHHHHTTTPHFDWDIRRFHVRYTSDPLYF